MSVSRALEELRPAIEAVARRAEELLRLQGGLSEVTPPPRPLHLAHYTSLEALISMLQAPKGGLRLSDSSTMNDPDEGCTTGDGRMFLKVLEDQAGTESWLWQRYSAAHICCFVGVGGYEQEDRAERILDAGDDLLFWRLYGDEGRGVSITIPPHVSHKLLENSLVQRVRYTDERLLQIDLRGIASLLGDLATLRERALAVGLWQDVCQDVLPMCDRLCAQRFLEKRAHYEMEREYRAVVFVAGTEESTGESPAFSFRGMHVQYGLVRAYVQIPELDCQSILTTNSQITIGSNVNAPEDARGFLTDLLRRSGLVASAVGIRVSNIRYRPR